MTRDSHKIKQGENYCHGNCVNLVWMLYLGMRGTSVLNIDCYWLNERVCVNCPLVRAVTDTRHLSVSWMMCWLQLDTWARDTVWCGPLVTELPAFKSLKRIPELWIIHISNTPTFKLIHTPMVTQRPILQHLPGKVNTKVHFWCESCFWIKPVKWIQVLRYEYPKNRCGASCTKWACT